MNNSEFATRKSHSKRTFLGGGVAQQRASPSAVDHSFSRKLFFIGRGLVASFREIVSACP
jgi:hypothetical protein